MRALLTMTLHSRGSAWKAMTACVFSSLPLLLLPLLQLLLRLRLPRLPRLLFMSFLTSNDTHPHSLCSANSFLVHLRSFGTWLRPESPREVEVEMEMASGEVASEAHYSAL